MATLAIKTKFSAGGFRFENKVLGWLAAIESNPGYWLQNLPYIKKGFSALASVLA